jgi:hypothetical protein
MMQLILASLLVILLVPSTDAQYFHSYLALDSTTFTDDVAHLISGQVLSQSLFPMTQLLNLGHDISLTQGYTITNLTLATTLTFAWSIRDVTLKPNVTLTDAYLSVVNHKCIGSVTNILVNGISPTTGGAASYPKSVPLYLVGSQDSYGNTFAAGHLIGFDFVFYFTSLTLNQAAILNVFVQADLYVAF